MAREYFYCARCQTRLTDEDFQTGRAALVRDQVSCEPCLGQILAPLSLKEQERILLQVREARERSLTARTPSRPVEPAAPPSAPAPGVRYTPVRGQRPAPVRAPSGGSHAGTVILLGILALGGTFAALYFLMGSHERTSAGDRVAGPNVPLTPPAPAVRVTKPDAARTPPRPAPVPADPDRDRPAREALEKARALAKAEPANLAAQVEAWRKAASACVGTPLAEEARRELDLLLARQKEASTADLAPLDAEVQAACAGEEFKRALDVLEGARRRYASSDWTQAVDARIRDVSVKHAWTAFIPLRDKAVEAHRRKAADEIRAIRDRVAKWGLATFVTELDRSIAAEEAGQPAPAPSAPPELKPPTEEHKAYQKLWQEALHLAGAREHDLALAALEKAAASLKEADSRKEAESDLGLLKLAAAAWREALQALASWPRGERVPLEYLDANAHPERLNEPFIRADRSGVEVMKGGEAVFVEAGDLTPRCLGEILKARGAAADARAAALLALLEGEIEAAQALLAGPRDAIPWKYWSYAAKMAEGRLNPASEAGRRELAARKLYFAAERERRATRTRGSAIEKYRALLNDFADTALVRGKRTHIAAQRETGRDYVFLPADLAAGGAFKSSKWPKLGDAWITEGAAGEAKVRESTVDFQFYALPDTAYRCWVHVGACCAETFTFYYQATDLTVPHPDTKELLKADPGANAEALAKHTITFLKARHDAHGGPREPRRWEWVALPLPKFASAGPKSVRLITDEKGFGIVLAVVSSPRTSPPSDSEVKAWLKPAAEAAAAEEAAPEPARRDPSLVGWWKLDEAGPTALDASGNDNTGILVGDPARGPGKIGNALALDGKDRYVNIPNSAGLERIQEGNFTLAAWFRPNARPAADGACALLMKTGQHEGLRYTPDQKFSLDHWLKDGTGLSVASGNAFSPGAFYHVAGVVSRTEGALRIFVNGRLEGTANFPAGGAPRDFGQETWKIGIAAPGRWAADGTVDDVRIYSRALTPNEVRILAGGAGLAKLSVALVTPSPGQRLEADQDAVLSASVTGGEGRLARVEFLLGTTVLGADPAAPYTFTWSRVPSGVYTLVARGVDRSGAFFLSAPVTFKVGNPALYRAINLGGPAIKVDGLDFEAQSARNISSSTETVDRKDVELVPPVDAARGSMIRSSVHGKGGTSVTLNQVPNGTYQVFLYVWSAGDPQTYDVLSRGKVILPRYTSGPAGHWEKLGPWDLTVTDGIIDVAARGGQAEFSGIEIWRVTR
jgi:hypothetical protein